MFVAAVEWSNGVENAWTKTAAFVPKFIGFLIVLFVGWLIVKAIARIADAALERVGFDRAVERSGINKYMEKSRYDASDVVSKLIYYALFLLVLQMAFGVFGPNPVSALLAGIIAYIPRLIVAALIVVVGFAIAAAVREIVRSAIGGLSYGNMIAGFAATAIVVISIFAALDQLQIAPRIVTGLFYAMLAVIVGSAIVAIGGSGIQPLRSRWENALTTWDRERPAISREASNARERINLRAEELKNQAQSKMGSESGSGKQQPQWSEEQRRAQAAQQAQVRGAQTRTVTTQQRTTREPTQEPRRRP